MEPLPAGVWLSHNQKNPYRVTLRAHGRQRHVGYYQTVEQAVRERDAFCKKHSVRVPKRKVSNDGSARDT